MKYSEKIESITSKVDKLKTQEFYLTQNLIKDDCSCDDCKFYQEEFIKFSLKIFKILDSYGVDLRKNINDEPTGVWIIRDKEKIIQCQPAYRIYGEFKEETEDTFEMIDNSFKVTIQVHKNSIAFVTLYITIDNTEE